LGICVLCRTFGTVNKENGLFIEIEYTRIYSNALLQKYSTMMSGVQCWRARMNTLQNISMSKQETSLVAHIRDAINRFVQAENVNKEKSNERLPKSQKTVED
jgi:hypothetical protein